MASGSSPTPASSSAPNSALKWDVFLSYSGPDTGPTFTAHLYRALTGHGIKTFKDDYKLRLGEVLPTALRKAIEESKIYVVVFSEKYASSTWCLDELVDIVRFHEKEGRLIIPVFYHIDPSIVRHVSIDKEEKDSSIYEKALQVHAKGYYKKEEQRVKSWLHALNVPANISGSHVCEKNREEPDVIEKIVAEILPRTNPKSFNETTVGLVGSTESIVAMMSSGATKIGIHGMGGVGKTTLARAVFDKIHLGFKGSCFLANVTTNSGTDEGMKSLQQQLLNDVLLQNEKDVHDVAQGKNLIETKLKDQKILVVIDDLYHSDRLESLGVKSLAHGSVVIITTRHEDILKYFEVKTEHRHMVNKLGPIESLKLFQQHAFGFGSEPDDSTDGLPFQFGSDTLKKLSGDILSLADGLPLALKIYGSVVRTKYEVEEWREFIEELKESPKDIIQDRLVISYNAIDRPELKKMFLDIACFFVGWQKERVFEILETYYPYVNVKINSLKGRCLLTIDDKNVLHMHDLLRDMGREVARNKSPGNPAKYSRLWLSTDIQRVLTEENEDLEAIEGIYYTKNGVTSGQVPITTKTFKRMKNLRFVHLDGLEFDNPIGNFDETFRDLSWLCWKSCPLPSFPPEFKPINLGILELRRSIMQNLEPSMVFQKLKILNMAYSFNLETTPDFNMLPCLVTINFERCRNLEQIHISIGGLAGLVSLNLWHCVKLASLPKTIGNLKKLLRLDVSYCERLVELPKELVNIESLESLDLQGCSKLLSIEELPLNLKQLNARQCLSIKIFRAILKQLEILNLAGCRALEEIQGLDQLTSVNLFLIQGCSKLRSITGFPPNLKRIFANDCSSLERLPNLSNLKRVEVMDLTRCVRLTEIQGLEELSSIRELRLGGCSLSVLQHIFTKRFFQTCSGFQNAIQIYLGDEKYLPSWMSQRRDSESRISLDLTPSTSHNFLGTILCLGKPTSVRSIKDTYSIENITSGFIWSDRIDNYESGRYIIIVPKSIFLVKNDDHRIVFTTEGRTFLAVHLLYDCAMTPNRKYDSLTYARRRFGNKRNTQPRQG